MTDVDFILGLLEARTAHACSCAITEADTDEDHWSDLRPLYFAEYESLRAIAQEIRASLASAAPSNGDPRHQMCERWLLVTEIGGAMTAKIFNEPATALEAKERFCKDHQIDGDFEPHAACAVEQISLPQRKTPRPGLVDGRFALIVHAHCSVSAEIYETLEEVEAAMDEAEDLHGEDGMCTYHEILVPALQSDDKSGS